MELEKVLVISFDQFKIQAMHFSKNYAYTWADTQQWCY